jgi:hypothetical protein
MSDYLTPTTELEAVNTILAVIGESPVSTLENIEAADAAIALNVLREVSRRVQKKGWHWNTEIDMTVTPNGSDLIVLATNILRIDSVTGCFAPGDIIERGGQLYNRAESTYEFSEAFDVTAVVLLPFDELPEAARDYITIRAARTYQQRQLGSVTLNNFSEKEEKDALATLEDAEAETADYNILTNNRASAGMYRFRRTLR